MMSYRPAASRRAARRRGTTAGFNLAQFDPEPCDGFGHHKMRGAARVVCKSGREQTPHEVRFVTPRRCWGRILAPRCGHGCRHRRSGRSRRAVARRRARGTSRARQGDAAGVGGARTGQSRYGGQSLKTALVLAEAGRAAHALSFRHQPVEFLVQLRVSGPGPVNGSGQFPVRVRALDPRHGDFLVCCFACPGVDQCPLRSPGSCACSAAVNSSADGWRFHPAQLRASRAPTVAEVFPLGCPGRVRWRRSSDASRSLNSSGGASVSGSASRCRLRAALRAFRHSAGVSFIYAILPPCLVSFSRCDSAPASSAQSTATRWSRCGPALRHAG